VGLVETAQVDVQRSPPAGGIFSGTLHHCCCGRSKYLIISVQAFIALKTVEWIRKIDSFERIELKFILA